MLQRMTLTLQQIPAGKAIKQAGQLAALPFILVFLLGLLGLPARGQVSVLTQNADTGRDAVYSTEIQLTPTSTIHKLFTTTTLADPRIGQAPILGRLDVPRLPP